MYLKSNNTRLAESGDRKDSILRVSSLEVRLVARVLVQVTYGEVEGPGGGRTGQEANAGRNVVSAETPCGLIPRWAPGHEWHPELAPP